MIRECEETSLGDGNVHYLDSTWLPRCTHMLRHIKLYTLKFTVYYISIMSQ